jgi:glycerophosphoryl diester phosphodiesterase
MAVLPVRPPMIVHHKAALDPSPYPPNSLEAIRACLEAGARFIEIDVMALASDDYLLVHDMTLEEETTGTGAVGACTTEVARGLFIRDRGQVTAYRPPLLSEVVTLFLEFPGTARLQIDYKDVYPSADDEKLLRLLRLIGSLGDRVLVSSGADWHLRRLKKLGPWLDVGFDIGFYLDYRPNGSDPRQPPYGLGDYGYHDDHLLAKRRMLPTSAYLAERCEIFFHSVPEASIWYVDYKVIAKVLDDGFNMADWLHDRGVKLDAWTLDVGKPAADYVRPLYDIGVDQFTSNTPHALETLLKG